MDYITLYTSEGSLNMPQEQKQPFREWAYSELSSAYPDFNIFVLKEPSTRLFDYKSEEGKIKKDSLSDFISQMFERWKRMQ